MEIILMEFKCYAMEMNGFESFFFFESLKNRNRDAQITNNQGFKLEFTHTENTRVSNTPLLLKFHVLHVHYY
jgi:hypothetical protein